MTSIINDKGVIEFTDIFSWAAFLDNTKICVTPSLESAGYCATSVLFIPMRAESRNVLQFGAPPSRNTM